ncbi:MAG: hydrogenase iron-sulfur subunit [Candidatus Lokiarchaeota archaeon]|nr:hydrogenase iron-sulfur subunit [Candidatus Lokiarchaeota archaeon]
MGEVLKSIGIEPERLQMAYCSSAEGQKFKETATKFHNQIKELGPNPLRSESTKKKAKT